MSDRARLRRIAQIIEQVDNRCMAADGPVTKTLDEMRQEELSEIYQLAARLDTVRPAEPRTGARR